MINILDPITPRRMSSPESAAVGTRFHGLQNLDLLFKRHIKATCQRFRSQFIRVVFLRFAEIVGYGRIDDIVQQCGAGNKNIGDKQNASCGRRNDLLIPHMIKFYVGKLMNDGKHNNIFSLSKKPLSDKYIVIFINPGIDNSTRMKPKARGLSVLSYFQAVKRSGVIIYNSCVSFLNFLGRLRNGILRPIGARG